MLKIGLVFAILYVFNVIPSSYNNNNYGPFTIKLLDARTCNGPKRKDCAFVTFNIHGETNLTCEMDIKENMSPMRGKITASIDAKNTIKVQITKPCDHIFMRSLLNSFMKVTEACVILKGHYIFTINMEELINKYYGGSFLYGNWTYKTVFYNEHCNFSCSEIKVAFIPKKKIHT